ncbi:MAG TPA: dTMP kinase [Patescibacteria group bacterium]|jgi:dTMP kinase|nr:dTMP kinase [Patescibacteria group bacterium]
MRTLKRGVLVSFEGIDGAGKSTLITLLSEYLYQDQIDHLKTKEPGGNALGRQLKNMLHADTLSLCSKAEYLLFAADRAQHMHEVVLPALARHTLVLSDRMADSSLAYQGYGRGLNTEIIQSINNWAMNDHTPDIVFFIRVPVTVALARIATRGTLSSFEQEVHFLEAVEKGFTILFSQKKNVIHIDGTESPNTVAQNIYNHLKDWLCQNNL